MIRTRLTLAPGQNGTKRLQRRFGDRLVCVRYRYDEVTKRRFKTVELVVEEVPWEAQLRSDSFVFVRIGFDELALRQKVKAEGGRWLPHSKVWELKASAARKLRLQARIMSGAESSDVDR